MSKDTKIKADRMDVFNGDYEEDSQIHNPPVAKDAKPVPAVQREESTEISTSPHLELHEDALGSPLKYVVSTTDAIEKVEELLELAKEGRPDLQQAIDDTLAQVDKLEQAAWGGAYERHESTEAKEPGAAGEAPEPAKFYSGQAVTVSTEEGEHNGELLDQNDNGTWEIKTEQNMVLSNVPEESISTADAGMTLPAALKNSGLLLASTDTAEVTRWFNAIQAVPLEEFLESQSVEELTELLNDWKGRLNEVRPALGDPTFIDTAIAEAEEILKNKTTMAPEEFEKWRGSTEVKERRTKHAEEGHARLDKKRQDRKERLAVSERRAPAAAEVTAAKKSISKGGEPWCAHCGQDIRDGEELYRQGGENFCGEDCASQGPVKENAVHPEKIKAAPTAKEVLTGNVGDKVTFTDPATGTVMTGVVSEMDKESEAGDFIERDWMKVKWDTTGKTETIHFTSPKMDKIKIASALKAAPRRAPAPKALWDHEPDEDEIREALEDEGIEFYFDRDKSLPSVDVRDRGYNYEDYPEIKKLFDEYNVPEELRAEAVQSTYEHVQENWWDDLREEGGPSYETGPFGEMLQSGKAKVYSAGRSGGHLVVEVPLHTFVTDLYENKNSSNYGRDAYGLDTPYVEGLKKFLTSAEESVQPKYIADMLSGQLEVDLEYGQFGGKVGEWFETVKEEKEKSPGTPENMRMLEREGQQKLPLESFKLKDGRTILMATKNVKLKADMKKLAEEALAVQDASNLSGVVNGMSRAMTALWDEARTQGQGTDWVNKHPITRLWLDKLNSLAGDVGNAYEEVYKLVEGGNAPAEVKETIQSALKSDTKETAVKANRIPKAKLKAAAERFKAKKLEAVKAPALAAEILASAFDAIEEIDLGSGWKARRVGGKKGAKKDDAPKEDAIADIAPEKGGEAEEPKKDDAMLASQKLKAENGECSMCGTSIKHGFLCDACGKKVDEQEATDHAAAETKKAAGPKKVKADLGFPEGDMSAPAPEAVKAPEGVLDGPEIEAPKEGADKPKDAPKETKEGAMIEIVDSEGKVKDTIPDAFGDDTVTIIKLLRQLFDIKDKKEGAAEEKKEGAPKEDEPKGLPKVDEKKEEKEEAKEEKKEVAASISPSERIQLEAARTQMEERVKFVRGVVAELVTKNVVLADQVDIDEELMKQPEGKGSLTAAMDAAVGKAVDREFKRLLALPDAELLTLKASLPNMKVRLAQVEIRASQVGLEPIDGLTVKAGTSSFDGAGFNLGDAFGRGGFGR